MKESRRLPLAANLSIAPRTAARKPRWSSGTSAAWVPFLYLTPAFLVMVTMTVFPFIYTLALSFDRWNLTFARPRTFIGFANYQSILSSADFWASVARTFWYVGSCVTIEFAAGILIAFLLDTQFIGRSLIRALILLPMVMAPVVAGLIWRFIFNDEWGLANNVLNLFGISSQAWLVNPPLAFFAVVVADVWQWTPFIALIALAGLQAVPKELNEAARVDGATWLQIQRFVTLPIMRPILAVGLLIRLIDCFRNVDQIFVMTYGGPGVATSVLGFYTYLKGFKFFDMGYTAALGIILVFMISVLAQAIIKTMTSSRHRRA